MIPRIKFHHVIGSSDQMSDFFFDVGSFFKWIDPVYDSV